MRWEELRSALEQIEVETVEQLKALLRHPKPLLEALMAVASHGDEPGSAALSKALDRLKKPLKGTCAGFRDAWLTGAAKHLVIASLRPLFQAKGGPITKLDKRLGWADVLPALYAADIEELREAIGSVSRACRFVVRFSRASSNMRACCRARVPDRPWCSHVRVCYRRQCDVTQRALSPSSWRSHDGRLHSARRRCCSCCRGTTP